MKDVEGTPISKFIDSKDGLVKMPRTEPDYTLNRPYGGQSYFKDPIKRAQAKRADNQSMINCGKTRVKGGFNQNDGEEEVTRDVYRKEID